MKKVFSIFALSVIALLVTACSSTETTESKNDSNKIDIYTTVYPLTYFAERIGGEYVNVSSIYPTGANEHTFEPTQQDMMSLAESDLFFYIGLGLEGFVEKAESTLANENVKFVSTSENIAEEKLHISKGHSYEESVGHEDENEDEHDHATEEHDDHNHGDVDPHIWLSPVLSQDLALVIKDELVSELPEQEEIFTDNYEALVDELEALDKEFSKLVSEASTKTFFISHSSFGYIAGQYGLIQVPIAGLNSQSEPTQKELIEIVDLAEELEAKYILFEQNVSSNLTSVIQNEIGAKSLTLHNLSVLTEQDVANDENYFTLMKKNIETFREALNP
ncbi:metal ABC transporter solute-binding protein, Zn/Mn family [Ureibacillus acetophenoni]|uniref:Zinc transport system substrate-binding protein n=1 Tax=Ureibacillus acetophenoni TaxID=614649 RepID=A0A285U7Y2_9BACL|nr:zinc ABC transporter substrate-binding protein [Ureibacillus acetophenoni]SOC36656.1 zinc transport system substrate-binding protein [Ureibacillus acetophenoni]